MSAQERRLAAIAAASADAFRSGDYHQVRAEDVAERIRLPRGGEGDRGRSAVWLYNEVRSRRVLVALAVKHAFDEFTADDPAPQPPRSLTEARRLVTAALSRVARFHRVERFMLSQVRLGIGDISTSEKRPSAGQSQPVWETAEAYGATASAGWEGRITAYAPYLVPRLELAALTAGPPPAGWAAASAARLSELAFRSIADDPDGPADHQAAALAAHWFARDLIPLAGEWAERLHVAEQAAEQAGRVGTAARACALEGVLQVLLDGSPLLGRAAEVGGELVALHAADPAGRRALCDAAGRQGLALLRLGDPAAARAAFERSLAAARELPPSDESEARVSRAEHNLAETLVEAGRPAAGLRRLEELGARRAAGVPATGVGPEWRRLTLTRQATARAATRAGRTVTGVTLAEAALADRERRLGADNVNTASARVTLAEALLAAGHPAQARHHLTEAMRLRAQHLPPESYWPQYDTVRLAEIELAAGFPGQAVRLLQTATSGTGWFARQVSPGLHAEATLVRCAALTAAGEAGQALDDLRRLPDDRRTLRARAAALLALGEASDAAGVLAALAADERDADDDFPGRAERLLLTARVMRVLGREDDSEAAGAALLALGEGPLDPSHPLILAGRLDLALLRVAAGRIDEVSRLVDPLLDRRPLAHGRPPLGEGHPLLAEARSVAARVGEPLCHTPEDRLWEDA
ncbi:tetratricopeptide (TPR) repeat protein [Streptosporangium becharense]|uniref:Tetratricopeptide (TPR) repeat protein n=1 Tax=Streptosporangium becharense TaxID=1816182 RepID=A0A7W9MJP2_9ACTN|nr:tetratricopeptide repeat protein [Streptosporangium becharense]MBB2914622.1 tetratricopeptide (TPR) repeat protein [Streptosporangium becharense]MBB5823467.1 tetratricopeptide (TPR) repeat protein [Streptosporangium becharense]